jgi:hypothetical protein
VVILQVVVEEVIVMEIQEDLVDLVVGEMELLDILFLEEMLQLTPVAEEEAEVLKVEQETLQVEQVVPVSSLSVT